MQLDYIDNLAYNGESFLHRASAPAKMLGAGFIVAATVLARGPLGLGLALGLLFLSLLAARLPVSRMLGFAAYAGFFAVVFAFSAYQGDPLYSLTIVLKGLLSAICLITLLSTTPYIEIFAVLNRFLPGLLVDMMLSTYRSFFILLNQTSRFMRTMRLRGAGKALRLPERLAVMARMMGHNLIHAWEMAERLERIMAVRGYRTGLLAGRPWPKPNGFDVIPLSLGLVVLSLVIGVGR